MKTIKISISDQARLDLDFLAAMLGKPSMATTVEALISAAVPVQIEKREKVVTLMPEFAASRPARVIVPAMMGCDSGNDGVRFRQ